MEIFTIDGRKSQQLKSNLEMLPYSELDAKQNFEKVRSKQNSVFRLRKKSLTTVVYLKIMNRRRMLELIGSNKY